MVTICLQCNHDIDMLENQNAAHAPDCPLWTNCMRCRKSFVEDDGSRIKGIKITKWSFKKRRYFPVVLCHECESDIHRNIIRNN